MTSDCAHYTGTYCLIGPFKMRQLTLQPERLLQIHQNYLCSQSSSQPTISVWSGKTQSGHVLRFVNFVASHFNSQRWEQYRQNPCDHILEQREQFMCLNVLPWAWDVLRSSFTPPRVQEPSECQRMDKRYEKLLLPLTSSSSLSALGQTVFEGSKHLLTYFTCGQTLLLTKSVIPAPLSEMENNTSEPAEDARRFSEHKFFYMIWVIFFGVILGIGGSLLENVQVNPMMKIFASGPFVIAVLTLNKIVLLRRFSITHMYVVASFIAIFTNYLGPPNPLKVLFVLAGLAFDAATLFRTKDLSYFNLICGHIAAALCGFSLSFLMTALLSRDLAFSLIPVFLIVGAIYIAMIFPISWIIWKTIIIKHPPSIVLQIRATIGQGSSNS